MRKHLFVTGGTGRAGRRVIDLAIARGHLVTALVRRPRALQARVNLRVVGGDVTRATELAEALPGHDSVICCLGQRSRDDAHLLRDATSAMLTAMEQVHVRRYLAVSQGLLFPTRNFPLAVLRHMLARRLEDSADMERLVQSSDTDWTIARPPRLVEGARVHGYRAEVGRAPRGAWSMSYGDLAAYLVDAAETGTHVRAIVGLASA